MNSNRCKGFSQSGFFSVLGVIFLVIWAIARFMAVVQFDRNCGGYLKRAADASTIELAIQELDRAMTYIEKSKLTSGYTSVVYKTPDEDVGFWYLNLKSALVELRKVGPETTQLERSNILLKLRETLLDKKESEEITLPSGVTIYPNNSFYAFWAIGSLLTIIIGSWLSSSS